jgi:gamma-glutamylcyclotransferase (GGCT)/AIG2-like uncharacterized protein YtfP
MAFFDAEVKLTECLKELNEEQALLDKIIEDEISSIDNNYVVNTDYIKAVAINVYRLKKQSHALIDELIEEQDNYINSDDEEDVYDTEVRVPERWTRADIMSVKSAVKANKSSKNHKLKPRSFKRDSTKTKDVKNMTKERLYGRM